VCCEEKEMMATFYLVPGNNGNLMSKDLAENLCLITVNTIAISDDPKEIVQNYPSVFNGIGLLKDYSEA
jgi:hypothetical protein